MILSIKKALRKSDTIRLYWEVLSLFFAKTFSFESDLSFTKRTFRRRTGKELDLVNPRTFSDKLNYLKLNYRDPLVTNCTDKYSVRDYVSQMGHSDILNEIYGVYSSFVEIDFDLLPSKFFLKCNHTSGANYFYDKDRTIDVRALEKKFNFFLKKRYDLFQREWNYRDIKPLIIAEKVITDIEGRFPADYKFFCFNGTPRLVMYCEGQCDENGERGEPLANFYDMDFNLTDLKINNDNIMRDNIIAPHNFDKMKEIAKSLSGAFPFCRVDLYNVDGRIFFGELTFFHAAGLNIITPDAWEHRMGMWLDLSCVPTPGPRVS